jgi:hypothetical protein
LYRYADGRKIELSFHCVIVSEVVMQQTLDRLRAEFLEMPGLRLTIDQVHRLCGVDRPMCSTVLDELVRENFLCRKSDGSYARLTDGQIARPRAAKADSGPDRLPVAS